MLQILQPPEGKQLHTPQTVSQDFQDLLKDAHSERNKKSFKCQKCEKELKTKYSLLAHENRVHNHDSTYFDCNRCSSTFKSKNELYYSIFINHFVTSFFKQR